MQFKCITENLKYKNKHIKSGWYLTGANTA